MYSLFKESMKFIAINLLMDILKDYKRYVTKDEEKSLNKINFIL